MLEEMTQAKLICSICMMERHYMLVYSSQTIEDNVHVAKNKLRFECGHVVETEMRTYRESIEVKL